VGHYIGNREEMEIAKLWTQMQKILPVAEKWRKMIRIMNKKIRFVLGLMFVVAMSRLLPHPPNFTPVAAMALLGGAMFVNKRLAFAVPLGAMLLSDVVIGWLSGAGQFGFHSAMPAVYVSFGLTVFLGFLLREKRGFLRVASMSLASSVLFFIVTNFAVWADGVYYAKNLAGLSACFVAAIPFFHYTVLGDACYVTLMFGAVVLAEKRAFSLPAGRA